VEVKSDAAVNRSALTPRFIARSPAGGAEISNIFG
jgi:hypothetical protein